MQSPDAGDRSRQSIVAYRSAEICSAGDENGLTVASLHDGSANLRRRLIQRRHEDAFRGAAVEPAFSLGIGVEVCCSFERSGEMDGSIS